MDQARYSRKISFILVSGEEVFPVMMKRRDTGQIAFRISAGGTGGNTLAAGEEVDEYTMLKRVLKQGFAVRCAPLGSSGPASLYKIGHRAVSEVRYHAA